MTLFDQLLPEYKEIMEQQLKAYPHTAKPVMKELKENRYFIELSYGTIGFLVERFVLRDYSPTSIAAVFGR